MTCKRRALGAAIFVLALGSGDESVPAAEGDASAAGARHDSVREEPGESSPPGQVDLVVRHTLERGRLIVRLAGSAFLSVPFASNGSSPALFERPLSVPSGRHPVEVSILDRRGKVVAQKRTEGTVTAGRPVVLHVDEHSGFGDGLTLTWRTP